MSEPITDREIVVTTEPLEPDSPWLAQFDLRLYAKARSYRYTAPVTSQFMDDVDERAIRAMVRGELERVRLRIESGEAT